MSAFVPWPEIVASETVQREAWHLLSHAAPPAVADRLGVRVERLGATLCQGARAVPGAQFNKVFAFGIDGDRSAAAAEAARSWMGRHCRADTWLMVPPTGNDGEDGEGDRMLRAAGFERASLDITVFHAAADELLVPTRASSVVVRAVGSDDADAFGAVLAEGLDAPVAAPWLAAFAVGHPGLTAYLAYDGPTPIGAAALFVDGSWGWLFIAAVRRGFRNRGAQTALLARRIADGRRAGVRFFNIGALRPAPGHADLFASFRNIERVGFRAAYHRPNYVWSGSPPVPAAPDGQPTIGARP